MKLAGTVIHGAPFGRRFTEASSEVVNQGAGRCQITLEADFFVFLSKSEMASDLGLKLWL